MQVKTFCKNIDVNTKWDSQIGNRDYEDILCILWPFCLNCLILLVKTV